MVKQLKLLIADDEPYICGMLEKLIDFHTLGLELIGFAHDGETLLTKIKQLKPDIVLTDISMPRMDGLEVIRQIKEEGIPCRFIIVSGYRQFEYAYNALKYNVDDYILKPVEEREINLVLNNICDAIRHNDLMMENHDDSESNSYLIEKAAHVELRSDTLSLEEINRTYHTKFQSGLYRVMLLKLDFLRDEKQTQEDVSSVINKLRELAKNTFAESCFDIVTLDLRDGVMFLINYAANSEADIQKQINSLFISAKNVVELFQGLQLTLCVGKSVSGSNKIEETKISCRRALWIRKQYGMDRILYEEKINEPNIDAYLPQMKEIYDNILKAFVPADIKAVTQEWNRFFSMPMPVLCHTQAMLQVRKTIEQFFEFYVKVVKEENNKDRLRTEFNRVLHMQTSFTSYQDMLISQFEQYMTHMADYVREKNVKPVRQACAYIEQHFSEHLSLETMAQIVNLSPVYFSNLFKKETGNNFTEYVTEYRMQKAKDMLKNGNDNINEIALALGYQNAQYFSKVFKKEVGVKPTDYRKIYG